MQLLLAILSWTASHRYANAHSNLYVIGEQPAQTQTLVAIPASWNVYLPNFGQPKLSRKAPLDREAVNVQPAFSGRIVLEPGATNQTRSLGCEQTASTPQVESLALLVERGLCTFREKADYAFRAGYKALIVSNSISGLSKVPDMTAPGGELEDRQIDIPAWSVELGDGQAIRDWLFAGANLEIQVVDSPRRPRLGPFQTDAFGLRQVFTK
mmetsp:Transcript_19292/g.36169  ORF Transcript_19292/g.36169 Transcript_19292/m.36169 type:complete len:211 (-) Transcript_19292:56-688(-)